MEYILIVLAVLWVIGWVKEMATVERLRNHKGIEYPNESVKKIMPLLLFFTWPYFYFYGKAI